MIGNFKINKYFLVSIGAIPGALLRFHLDQTLAVNIIGCFLIGLINKINLPVRFKLIFSIGFCASLTTFSGWIFDLFKLFSNGLIKEFIVSLILAILTGLFAVYLGNIFGKFISRLV